jgi:hypothetical protein
LTRGDEVARSNGERKQGTGSYLGLGDGSLVWKKRRGVEDVALVENGLLSGGLVPIVFGAGTNMSISPGSNS